eukprot:1391083-Amorphochlora_amoeboformis.AAC.1
MERVEWIKPIMFTGGIGQIDNLHIAKGEAKKGTKKICGYSLSVSIPILLPQACSSSKSAVRPTESVQNLA